MRIRKYSNFSLSAALYTLPTLHPHVCQLNRSPWDVMPFSLDSDDHSFPNEYQREVRGEEDGEEGKGGLIGLVKGISAAADGSNETEFLREEEKKEEKREEKKRVRRNIGLRREANASKRNSSNGKKVSRERNKNEGKGHFAGGDSHPTQQQQQPLSSDDKWKSEEDTGGGGGRGWGRKKRGRATSSSLNSEYYYYSGFGPSWSRKRGVAEASRMVDDYAALPLPLPSSSPSSSASHDVHDDNGHDEETATRKTRKRVKARSLKSLL